MRVHVFADHSTLEVNGVKVQNRTLIRLFKSTPDFTDINRLAEGVVLGLWPVAYNNYGPDKAQDLKHRVRLYLRRVLGLPDYVDRVSFYVETEDIDMDGFPEMEMSLRKAEVA